MMMWDQRATDISKFLLYILEKDEGKSTSSLSVQRITLMLDIFRYFYNIRVSSLIKFFLFVICGFDCCFKLSCLNINRKREIFM